MTFGEWIRQSRKERPDKMSQDDLARAVGVSKGYISQIENDCSSSTGLPPRVSDDHLRALAGVLGLDAHEVFTRATNVIPHGFSIVPEGGKPISSGSLFVSEILAKYPDGDKLPASEVAQIREELEDYAYTRIGRHLERQVPQRKRTQNQPQKEKQEQPA